MTHASVPQLWETIDDIEKRHGLVPEEVGRMLLFLGLAESKAHSRGEGRDREYSPAIVLLFEREMRSRGRLEQAVPA